MDPRARIGWEHFEHRADLGVRGRGPTPEAAFAHVALALTAAVCDPARVEPRQDVWLDCSAPDAEILLVDFLNAVIYEMATRRMLFGEFDVRIDGHDLVARARGEVVDPERHALGTEPKGATFTALHVGQEPDGAWVAQCVIDV